MGKVAASRATVRPSRRTDQCTSMCREVDAPQEQRSWSGIPVLYLGRLADIGTRVVMIGEPCGECAYGRVILNCGVLRCNTCQHSLGELRRFDDEGFSVRRAIQALQDGLST